MLRCMKINFDNLAPRPTNMEEAQALIEDLVHRYDPPIRVVQESTWALKAGGLVHCAV